MHTKNPTLWVIDFASGILYGALLFWEEGKWQLKKKKVLIQEEDAIDKLIRSFPSDPPLAFALGEGPGYFTSLRNSFSYIKTLAFLWKRPIYLFSSLLFYASLLKEEYSIKEDFLLLMQANREILHGVFQKKIYQKTPEEWDRWMGKENPPLVFLLKSKVASRYKRDFIRELSYLSLQGIEKFFPSPDKILQEGISYKEALPKYATPLRFKKYVHS